MNGENIFDECFQPKTAKNLPGDLYWLRDRLAEYEPTTQNIILGDRRAAVLGRHHRCLSDAALRKDYAQSHWRTSLFAMIGACLIYPPAILVYTRKAIAQRNGDWKTTIFILSVAVLCCSEW